MYYASSISTARVAVIKNLIDAGSSNGRLEIMDGTTILAQFGITRGAFTNFGTGQYYATFVESTVTCLATGIAQSARVVDSDGNQVLGNIPIDVGKNRTANINYYVGVALNRTSFTIGDTVSLDSSLGVMFARFNYRTI